MITQNVFLLLFYFKVGVKKGGKDPLRLELRT